MQENKKIIPSQEQSDIINAVRLGVPRIMVNAGAGTGKSTLLEIVVDNISPNAKKLYLVYNKSGEVEAIERFKKHQNIMIKTVDAFARYLVLGKSFEKVTSYRKQHLEEMLKITPKKATEVLNLMDKYCNSDDIGFSDIIYNRHRETLEEFWNLMDKGEISKSFGYIIKKAHLGLIDGSYSHKVEDFKLVMIDEFQDTNRVSKAIFDAILADTHIMVGDKNQAIYGFRGAENMMYIEAQNKSTQIYPLTTSYRYNQTIANKANYILKNFKGDDTNLKGLGKVTNCRSYCMLSRTNAELILGIDKVVTANKKFKTIRKASDIFDTSISLALLNSPNYGFESKKDYINSTRPNTKFLMWEYAKYQKNKKGSFLEWLKENNKDIEIQTAIKICERYSYPKLVELEKITDEYNKIYSNDEINFFLSTMHTAKGLEFDHITIADDTRDYIQLIAKYYFETYGEVDTTPKTDFIKSFANDVKDNLVDKAIVEEFNLLYVAITRAKAIVKLPPSLEILYDKDKTNFAINNAYKEIVEKNQKDDFSLSVSKSNKKTDYEIDISNALKL